MISGSANVRAVAEALGQAGYYVAPVTSPTVAVGEERLRLTVTPFHTAEMIAGFVKALDRVCTQLGVPDCSARRSQGRVGSEEKACVVN